MSEEFSMRKNWQRIEASLVEAFMPIPVANVSDSMARMDSGGSELRPMHRDGKLAGPALTVRMRPGDNLMLHKAIDMAQPGDRSEEHTSELQSLMRNSYAVSCLTKKRINKQALDQNKHYRK